MKKIAYISCFYNPANFKRPVRNCYNFLRHTVDKVFPKDDFFFGQINYGNLLDTTGYVPKENTLNLNTQSVLWHKERILNILVEKFKLIEKYRYICWLDSDIWFDAPITSIPETVLCQPFKYSFRSKVERKIDFTKPFHLDGDKFESFALNPKGDKGLSWMIESEYWDEIGGLFDYSIVGGGDSMFLKRVFGEKFYTGCIDLDNSINSYIDTGHLKKKDVSYLDTQVYHAYHGKTINRQYYERMRILRKYEFNPENDLIVEKSGLYRVKNEDMHREIKEFFLGRKEDD